MRVSELETPLAVVDLDTVDRNITRMQAYADAHGLRLRPHIKTHKLPFLVHRQLRAGASGICAQKLSEAEVMALCGIEDIRLTYNVIGEAKARRLARLAGLCRVSVALDNAPAAEAVSRAAVLAGAVIEVLIEFDAGGDRMGVRTAAGALALADHLARLPGLRLVGLMTHPLTARTAERAAEIRALCAGRHPLPELSVGGTPGALRAHEVPGATELRVGTYLFNDRMMVQAGAATPEDCALHVHATVVSRPTPDRAILDAGSKSLASDLLAELPGHGGLVEYPEASIVRLNEEHAIVDLTGCQRVPAVGERVRIVPNHVCVVTNLHDHLILARGEEVLARPRVLARGQTL